MSGLEAVAPSCRQDASPRLVKAKYGPAPSLHFPLSRPRPFGLIAARMPTHAHPRRSGSREQRIGRRVGVEVAALEDASEEIRALFAAVEPVAALARVCL